MSHNITNNITNKVVVVEGAHDLAVLKRLIPSIEVVITNGSEISQATLDELKKLNETKGLLLFLDPDMQGERIRRIINDYVGDTSHAFLPKHKCISSNKRKVGIEHAKDNDILQALSTFKVARNQTSSDITMQDLFALKLHGHKQSKRLRKMVSEEYGIGLCNGKTLLTKLTMFNIQKQSLETFLRGVK